MNTEHRQAPIDVVVFGLGDWAQTLIPALAETVNVRYCFSRGGQAGRSWLELNSPHTVLRTAENIDSGLDVDAAVIATPIETHVDIALLALSADLHVWLEKPMAKSVADAARLTSLASSKRRTLFVSHTFLYDPAYSALKSIIQGSSVVEAELTWHLSKDPEGDLVWSLLPHDIALCIDLFGSEPVDIRIVRSSEDGHQLELFLYFDGLRKARISISRQERQRFKRIEVLDEFGRSLRWQNESLLYFDNGAWRACEWSRDHPDAIRAEIFEFCNALTNREKLVSDGRFGIAVTRGLEKVWELLNG